MNANELTADQKAKVDSCKTPDDVIALAKDEGFSLSDDELEQISAGAWSGSSSDKAGCPSCGKTNLDPQGMHTYKCRDCGYVFKR